MRRWVENREFALSKDEGYDKVIQKYDSAIASISRLFRIVYLVQYGRLNYPVTGTVPTVLKSNQKMKIWSRSRQNLKFGDFTFMAKKCTETGGVRTARVFSCFNQ